MQEKIINYGICILKMLMCFLVIVCHFWISMNIPSYLKPIEHYGLLAVPVFMFLSFYLTANTFIQNNTEKFYKRIKRILIPLIGWGYIYWQIYTFEKIFFHIHKTLHTKDLFWQIFTGHSPNLNTPMWYLSVLCLICILFCIIFKYLNKKQAITVLIALFILSQILIYTGINDAISRRMCYELKYSLGRLFLMLPFAISGFLFSYYKLFEKMKRYRYIAICTCAILSFILIEYMFKKELNIYTIPGIISTCLIVAAMVLIPFEKANTQIKNFITTISKYTLGIYCLHIMIGRKLIYIYILHSKETVTSRFIICILIYLIGYFISFLISKIPYKTLKQLVE